jgi:hypothetical protein
MEIILFAIMTVANVLCFVIGARVGQKVTKGDEIKMPSVNPMDAYRKHEAKKEAEHKQNVIAAIMENIDAYDGTSNGQKEVPRG